MKEDVIFKHYQKVDAKLLEYGFKQKDNAFFYETLFMNNKFLLKIMVAEEITIDVIDVLTNEKFMPFYVTNSVGSFVGDIRKEIDKILFDIKEKCFVKQIFKTKLAYQIIDYIDFKYHHKPEYLWKDYPENAVFRNHKNEKWYCAILTAKKKSIGINEDGEVEVLNLKGDPLFINEIIDNHSYFLAYHMNKKHWYTVLLNQNIPFKEVMRAIDDAYQLVEGKNKEHI